MKRGEIGGEPAALLAVGMDELYAALHDGTIKRSTDGGASWTGAADPGGRWRKARRWRLRWRNCERHPGASKALRLLP